MRIKCDQDHGNFDKRLLSRADGGMMQTGWPVREAKGNKPNWSEPLSTERHREQLTVSGPKMQLDKLLG
jgi:hypothetical protein